MYAGVLDAMGSIDTQREAARVLGVRAAIGVGAVGRLREAVVLQDVGPHRAGAVRAMLKRL